MPFRPSQRIVRLSRDRRFLIRAALGIGAIFFLIALLVSQVTYRSSPGWVLASLLFWHDNPEEAEAGGVTKPERALDILVSQNPGVEEVAEYIRSFAFFRDDDEATAIAGSASTPSSPGPLRWMGDLIARVNLEQGDRTLLLSYNEAMLGTAEEIREQGKAALKDRAGQRPPVRFANEFLADVEYFAGNYNVAVGHYKTEAEFPEAGRARKMLYDALLRAERPEEAAEVKSTLNEGPDPHSLIDRAVEERDWLALARAVIAYDFQIRTWPLFALSLFAGGIWFVITAQLAGFHRRRLIFYAAALGLGILSTSATLYAVIIQENVRGFEQGETLLDGLIYCIAGIGLREESIKLLFFLPLIPFLRRRPDIDALVCAGLVGLGFAIQENIGYYAGFGGKEASWGRFLTANFMHLAWTGLIGYAAVLAFRSPKTQWEQFLGTFLAVVAIHGMYDAFLIIPELLEYGIFSIIIFALVAYRYFNLAHSLQTPQPSQKISPLGIFVIGSAVLIGVVLVFATAGQPFRPAFGQYAAAVLGIFPIAFVFINEFKHS